MNARPIVMYLGGFAKVGGIESFARDFLLALAPAYPKRELVVWGEGGGNDSLLGDIARSGATIIRSPWRWGCAWSLPDFVLAPLGLAAVRRAAAVIFKRPPPPGVMRWLRSTAWRDGRRVPFILITPYRPGEYWRQTSRTVLDDFDVITVQSEEGIDDLRKLGYRRRIENIPLLPPASAEPAPFAAELGEGRIRLGFLGRMAPQKNLDYLFEVYERLSSAPKDDLSYELHLFGDGAERRQLTERCAARALPDVTFHGEIPRESVCGAIDTCDIFLNTSRTEGQCLAALEVLSRGRPLVATPVGALPEVLAQPDLGKLAPLDDPGAFAAKVTELAGEIREGRVSPRSVSEAFRKRYDAQAVLQRYLDLLADVGGPGGD